jgi:selenocysteine lyase/cysteine desulfurase
MLGPEGVAVFYCRPALRTRLTLFQYGWHMVEDHLHFDRQDWEVARSARRFECGSPNMLGISALSASLSLLLEVGIGAVAEQILAHTAYLKEAIQGNADLTLLSPAAPERASGIVTFRSRRVEPAVLYQRLGAAGIVCALRGGGIRFSPHFYTSRDKLEAAMQIVQRTIA